MAAMAKSILAPPLHQVYWKIASEIISGVPKKGHFKTESQDLDWLVGSRSEKHHGQQADHPTLDSAKCCVPIFKDYLNSAQFISSIHSSQLGSTSKSRFNSFCLKILWLAQSPPIFPK